MLKNKKSIFFPPGGFLIWIILLVEMITFFIGISSLLYEKRSAYADFIFMQSSLNIHFGLWNTIFLITSGFFMAIAVHFHKSLQTTEVTFSLLLAIFFGVFFLILKSIEYVGKLNAGYTIDFSDFFAFYWLLTGFHFLHVFVGLLILIYIYLIRNSILHENFESGATFWHMCDLIWIILFPALYLVR